MSDNTQIASGSGDTIRDKDRSGVKTQIVLLDLNTGGVETLVNGSIPVTILAGTAAIGKVAPTAAGTGTLSSVGGTVAANTTILAANAARLGGTIYNDSSATLYIALATTCSTTSFTIAMAPGGYYEIPTSSDVVYTGVITGVWASATGNARVTELTA